MPGRNQSELLVAITRCAHWDEGVGPVLWWRRSLGGAVLPLFERRDFFRMPLGGKTGAFNFEYGLSERPSSPPIAWCFAADGSLDRCLLLGRQAREEAVGL